MKVRKMRAEKKDKGWGSKREGEKTAELGERKWMEYLQWMHEGR